MCSDWTRLAVNCHRGSRHCVHSFHWMLKQPLSLICTFTHTGRNNQTHSPGESLGRSPNLHTFTQEASQQTPFKLNSLDPLSSVRKILLIIICHSTRRSSRSQHRPFVSPPNQQDETFAWLGFLPAWTWTVIDADQNSRALLLFHSLITAHLHIYDKNVLLSQWLIVYRHVWDNCRNGGKRLSSIDLIGFLI